MDSLEAELRAIWDTYEPQRAAERDAAKTAAEAWKDLQELNAKRAAKGLPHVTEYRDQSLMAQLSQQGNVYMGPPPKTWRNELDEKLLAAVRRRLE